jgi:1,5-anhydro-D-fructose reductase (1,5-anhydro-D-mannitol-forming)
MHRLGADIWPAARKPQHANAQRSSEMTLGWGILGTAGIADRAVAPAIAQIEGANLVAVLSRERQRGEEFARKHGAARVFTDYRELLADGAVDVVYVASPNGLHAEQVIAAAAAGKHVFCDKPLATSVQDARRAVDACRSAGVKLGINFQTRHHQFVTVVRQALAEGRIGDVLIAEVEVSPGRNPLGGWRTDPELAGLGTINNLGVHGYDLLRYLLGQEVVEVTALLDVGRQDVLETVALALLRFSGGSLAYVNANQAVPNFRPDLVFYGSEGRIVGESVTRPGLDGRMRIYVGGSESSFETSSRDAFLKAVAQFQRAVMDDVEPVASGLDGLRSVELTEAIARSAREGRTIQVEAN